MPAPDLWRGLTEVRAGVAEIRARRSRPDDAEIHDWFAAGCPCGVPAGDCKVHPRARHSQRPPAGDWRTWAFIAGRGSGKTRSGAEWVRHEVESGRAKRIALVGATAADVRDVMILGPGGIMDISPPSTRPKYEPSKRRLVWPNGAIALTFSAEEPERLRGPQSDLAWCDEVGAWAQPGTWDNLMLGLRLGDDPRVFVSTTPRSTQLLRRILNEKTTSITRATTFDNRAHLAPPFFESIVALYEGTRLGCQEIYGELLDIAEGAWFTGFNPGRHVTELAEYDPALPVRLAIDAGVSAVTGACWLQIREHGAYNYRVTVFGDYLGEGLYSEANATAIKAQAETLTRGRIDLVRVDPAATARTGIGTAAYHEYARVFGSRLLSTWPVHRVLDGLDQIELLLGGPDREPDLLIHPRCVHMIDAFKNYHRAQRAGEWLDYPKDGQHPYEDLMDALRGGIRDAYPEGRRPKNDLRQIPFNRVF
jgi:phage terminase large subunit-like protein